MKVRGRRNWRSSSFIAVLFICLSIRLTKLSVEASTPNPSTQGPVTKETTAPLKLGSTLESKSESTTEPPANSKLTTEPGSGNDTTLEPITATGTSTIPRGVPEENPNAIEFLLPPFSLIILIVTGLCILSLTSRYKIRRKIPWGRIKTIFLKKTAKPPVNFTLHTEKSRTDSQFQGNSRSEVKETAKGDAFLTPTIKDDAFLTPFDLEALESLKTFNNRPSQLSRIAAPAVLSLALCPVLLYIYGPMVTLFWPHFAGQPNINEAIACFLAPAGLVYATSFGFAFQQVLAKQQDLLAKISYEIGLLDQILTLSSKLNLPSQHLRMGIYRALKSEAMFMILQIENRNVSTFKNKPLDDVREGQLIEFLASGLQRKATEADMVSGYVVVLSLFCEFGLVCQVKSYGVKIWEILDLIRGITLQSQVAFDVDRIIADKIVSHILQLNSICSDRMGQMHSHIHPLKWAFLETLGFFSFFGVLLLRAESYRMELCMCIITVFSISLLCYVVSDLDSPFSGFFRIDISVLNDVMKRCVMGSSD